MWNVKTEVSVHDQTFKNQKEVTTMVANACTTRITTAPEQNFVQCAPLPVREQDLEADNMQMVTGGVVHPVVWWAAGIVGGWVITKGLDYVVKNAGYDRTYTIEWIDNPRPSKSSRQQIFDPSDPRYTGS